MTMLFRLFYGIVTCFAILFLVFLLSVNHTQQRIQTFSSTRLTNRRISALDAKLRPLLELNISQIVHESNNDFLWPSDCDKPIDVLICVCSAQNNSKARQTIRMTFGQSSYLNQYSAKMVFTVGWTLNADKNEEIIQENKTFGDLVIGNFIDTYNNLTLKAVTMLKFALNQCSNAKHVMKLDDDVYVNVPSLIEMLKSWPSDTIAGFLKTRPIPYRNLEKPKWYVPPFMWESDIFPPYVTGPAYVLPKTSIKCLYQEALTRRYLYLEDVFVTGILREACNIDVRDQRLFIGKREPILKICPTRLITVHHVSPSLIKKLWKDQHNPNTQC